MSTFFVSGSVGPLQIAATISAGTAPKTFVYEKWQSHSRQQKAVAKLCLFRHPHCGDYKKILIDPGPDLVTQVPNQCQRLGKRGVRGVSFCPVNCPQSCPKTALWSGSCSDIAAGETRSQSELTRLKLCIRESLPLQSSCAQLPRAFPSRPSHGDVIISLTRATLFGALVAKRLQ